MSEKPSIALSFQNNFEKMSKNLESAENPYNILIIGRSGGGKTVASNLLVDRIGYRVVLLNGNLKEYTKHIKTNIDVNTATWDKVPLSPAQSRIVYAVEDISSLRPAHRDKLKTLLNYTSRHCQSVCILIAHSVHTTGLFAMLNFLTDIYLTQGASNLRTLKFLLKYFFYKDVEPIEQQFSSLPLHHYLHLQPQSQIAAVVDNRLKPIQSNGGALKEDNVTAAIAPTVNRDKILNYFSGLNNSKLYTATLDFLLANIPADYVQGNDLSVKYKTKRGEVVKFSLLDYIHFLNSDQIPPLPIKKFHHFLSKSVCFPQFLIQNALLK